MPFRCQQPDCMGCHGGLTWRPDDRHSSNAMDEGLRSVCEGNWFVLVFVPLRGFSNQNTKRPHIGQSSHPNYMPKTLRKIVNYFNRPQDEYLLDPSYEHTVDGHNPDNVEVFKDLQKMAGVGLVVPVDEEHMYYAAIYSKSCRLTTLGAQYWNYAAIYSKSCRLTMYYAAIYSKH